ncbi:MAG: heme-binding domain-containing protein, partial [Anaerolineae bacterium]
VHEGRDALNISTDRRIEWDEMAEMIDRGQMPPPVYLPLHPEANLTSAQQETLIAGIRATFR